MEDFPEPFGAARGNGSGRGRRGGRGRGAYRSAPSQPARGPTILSKPIDSRPEANMVHASERTGAVRNGEFSWRAPSPPHIHIPQTPDDVQLQLPPYIPTDIQDPTQAAILSAVVNIRRKVVPCKDWKYQWRRSAQSILSFLYLGPTAAARDIEFLIKEGITMLLVVRDIVTAQGQFMNPDKVAQKLGIESVKVDVNGNPELIRRGFSEVVQIINDHILKTANPASIDMKTGAPNCGKVLVYCESGNERSAAVVTAYLMKMFGINAIQGIQFVQAQRFCISFDDSLKNLLYSYKELLTAQREVMSAPNPPQQMFGGANGGSGGGMAPTKRGRDDVTEDEDVDMGIADDKSRFGGRSSFVPFK